MIDFKIYQQTKLFTALGIIPFNILFIWISTMLWIDENFTEFMPIFLFNVFTLLILSFNIHLFVEREKAIKKELGEYFHYD